MLASNLTTVWHVWYIIPLLRGIEETGDLQYTQKQKICFLLAVSTAKNTLQSVETHLRLGGERDLERLLDCERDRLTLRVLLRLLARLIHSVHRHPTHRHRHGHPGEKDEHVSTQTAHKHAQPQIQTQPQAHMNAQHNDNMSFLPSPPLFYTRGTDKHAITQHTHTMTRHKHSHIYTHGKRTRACEHSIVTMAPMKPFLIRTDFLPAIKRAVYLGARTDWPEHVCSPKNYLFNIKTTIWTSNNTVGDMIAIIYQVLIAIFTHDEPKNYELFMYVYIPHVYTPHITVVDYSSTVCSQER